MSLFQFGFHCCNSSNSSASDVPREQEVPLHFPALEDCGLGTVEYDSILATSVTELMGPSPPAKKLQVA